MKIDGSGHCGKITFDAELDESRVIICHCTDRQTFFGSAFRTVAFLPDSPFRLLSGETKLYVKTADSGNKREQNFCPKRGSPKNSTPSGKRAKHLGIPAGIISQRDRLIPTKQVWSKLARNWLAE